MTGGPLRIRVLGPVQAEVAGNPVRLGGRQQALLAVLVTRANTVVSVSQLADALWGDDVTEQAANAVQTIVSRLRRTLGAAHDAVRTQPPGYLLVADDDTIDARQFESLIRAARTASAQAPHHALELCDSALALWRGSPYGAFGDDLARGEAVRLDELHVAAKQLRAELALNTGAIDDAIARASSLASEHPFREAPVELLMRALHTAGRTADALNAYRQHRGVVADEMGLEPSAALQRLEQRVLADDLPSPPAAAPTQPQGPAADSKRPHRDPAASWRHDLPWRPSDLIGRDEDLARVHRALEAGRAATIVGPGGVGKTRLAVEVAHTHDDEVWWVDLTTAQPGGALDAIAAAVQVEVARDPDRARNLCTVLSARRGLLCIDNAEHVLDEVAAFVERLLATATDIAVLVTSRERLNLDREVVCGLAPLPTPQGTEAESPSVRLFLDRWQRADGRPPDGDELAMIAELCRGLDGLPLAIELGAASTSTLGLPAIAERLGARLELLHGGRRTAAPRHRTLRAVVDWSYDLLTPDEAQLLARLATFPGAFTIDQMERVCAGDGLSRTAVAPLLSRLIEQSLVQAAPQRFWLLETLRGYAAERLDDGLSLRLRQRHAEDTAARLAHEAERLWTPDEAAAVAALHALAADLHGAFAHALDHDLHLAVELAADVFGFAYVRQRLDLLRWSAVVAARDVDHPRMPDVLAAAATVAWAAADLESAHDLAERGIALGGGTGQLAAARALDIGADLAMFAGRTDDAVAGYQGVAAIYREAGAPLALLMADIATAQAHCYGTRWRDVAVGIPDLLRRAHDSGTPTTLAFAYFVAGEASAREDRAAALAAYTAAIEHGEPADSRLFVALARSAAAALGAAEGPPAPTAAAFLAVLDEWQRLDNEGSQWGVLQSSLVLLVRLRLDHAAAVVAGAVLAHHDPHMRVAADPGDLEGLLAQVRSRQRSTAVERWVAEGTRLPVAEAIAIAREALRSVVSEMYET